VIVAAGQIVGASATAPTGRPHAEPQAIEMAGELTIGAQVYVTLEPCSHYGKTPPCAEALIAANPAEIIIACTDPYVEVAGRGIAMLEKAGIQVRQGVRQAQAEQLNQGFFSRIKTGRPAVFKDDRPGLYDGPLMITPNQNRDDALRLAGERGLTRLFETPRETTR
jgi:diaminohydroxyphosphoribosylaminopyrimidine deaminase/5-amino-6-(5-phosphoribosylamino)uracil reductase